MSNEKMREEFEAWAINDAKSCGAIINPTRDGDWYFEECSNYLNTAWAAWQASREALVIELPTPYAVIGDYAACGGGRSVFDVDYAGKITDRMCEKTAVYDRATIEAAGLKVKP